MSELVVRAYNVLFGDAILISIPEDDGTGGEVTRTVLIDVGNLLASSDDVFVPVVSDIKDRTTRGKVDLYLMTHEHLDHVQGLGAAAAAGVKLGARYAWLTGSAHPDYYQTHDDARRKRVALQETYSALVSQHRAGDDPWLAMMIRNNSAMLPGGALGASTGDYVNHLRAIAPAGKTHYVDRTTDLRGKHPFREAELRILAPEEDTSAYYGRRPRLSAAAQPDRARADGGESAPQPPAGVDAGAFYDLLRSRQSMDVDTILAIDKAANNTSIVLEVRWRGWRLLFGGDAEERSWHTILTNQVEIPLEPVHFVKISHHGSINGTLREFLDVVLPGDPPDERPRQAIVSTHKGDWDSVPDPGTLRVYRNRCTVLNTSTVAEGEAVEARFSG